MYFEIFFRLAWHWIEQTFQVNYNESSWNYLRGILKHANDEQKSLVTSFLEKDFSSGKKSIFSLSILLDTYESAGKKDLAQQTADELKEQDVIRASYWDFRSRLLQEEWGDFEAACKSHPSCSTYQRDWM